MKPLLIQTKSKVDFFFQVDRFLNFCLRTDKMIQKMFRIHLKEKTVLTIAHRLLTVMDYDEIVAIKKEGIEDFDTPKNLLEREGVLKTLVKRLNLEDRNNFLSVANNSERFHLSYFE